MRNKITILAYLIIFITLTLNTYYIYKTQNCEKSFASNTILPSNRSKTNNLLTISRQTREAICVEMTSGILNFLQSKNLTKEDLKEVYKRMNDGCSKIQELTDLEEQNISDK